VKEVGSTPQGDRLDSIQPGEKVTARPSSPCDVFEIYQQ
jgi:hypothetical protein